MTVVVPTYNGADWLGMTLDSLAAQTRRDFDVVVVDDGSTDASAEIARAHPIVSRLETQQNLGVAVARNRGCALAETPWVTFLDQDDLWHSSRWARLAPRLNDGALLTTETRFTVLSEREHLAPDLLEWAQHRVDEGKELVDLVMNPTVGRGTDQVVALSANEVLTDSVSATTSFIARRSLVLAVGGFAAHARACDDYYLLANLARVGGLVRLDQPTLLYRIHSRATSRTTQLALPFLTSLIALRHGGVLRPHSGDPIAASSQRLAVHLLVEHVRVAPREGLLTSLSLLNLLSLSPRDRASVRWMLLKAAAERRVARFEFASKS